jgi:quercetin dioxygenase-like cupin family protein
MLGPIGPRALRVLRPGDVAWRLDRNVLVGLFVSTEHLTAGTLRVLPGQRSLDEAHAGDELVFVTSGELRVTAGDVEAALRPGDAFSIPAGVVHRYAGGSAGAAEALFGVAPSFRAPA